MNDKTRKITTLGMLAALSVALVFFIHFPIFPAAPFLEYDPADIPILVGTFALGPVAGLVLTVVASLIQGFTVSAASGPYGILMHVLATGTYVLVAGLIYRGNKTRKRAAVAIICGVIAWTVMMVAANLVITPLFMGAKVEDVAAMLLPVIIPFNLLKASINGLVTFIIYKPLSNLIQGRKTTKSPAE